MVSWLHCFWACGEAASYGGEHIEEEATHLPTVRKQKQRGEGDAFPQAPLRAPLLHIQALPALHWPHLLQDPPPFNSAELRTKPPTDGSLWDVPDQIMAGRLWKHIFQRGGE
jgi:hypothetical protein